MPLQAPIKAESPASSWDAVAASAPFWGAEDVGCAIRSTELVGHVAGPDEFDAGEVEDVAEIDLGDPSQSSATGLHQTAVGILKLRAECGKHSSAAVGAGTAAKKAAIEKLVSESLLVRRSNKTARLVTLTPEDVRDISKTRALLEKAALLQLAELRSVPAGVDSLDSPRTSRMYSSLISQVKLCMAQVQGLHLVQPDRIIKEHRHLLDLIEAGDGAAAAEFLEEHLARPRERLAAAIGGETGPEADLDSTVEG